MVSATHLLDTSAILAHYLDEPGAEAVDQLWVDRRARVAVCVLSLPELKARLSALVSDRDEAGRAYRLYTEELTTALPVTRDVAVAAIELRDQAIARLPLVDAVIAACAKCNGAILVHRDAHMSTIPSDLVEQLALPEKG